MRTREHRQRGEARRVAVRDTPGDASPPQSWPTR
jgi:hypothetical protein